MFRTQPGELRSGEASFCGSGTQGDRKIMTLIPLKKKISPNLPPATFTFSFKNQLKEKRFAHLVITNGDMNYGDAPD